MENAIDAVLRIAHYIHPPDNNISLEVACDAIDWVAQKMKSSGSVASCAGHPTRFKLPETMLLFEGVFHCSEKWELDQERNPLGGRTYKGNNYLPNEEDLMVRYIKFLIFSTLCRKLEYPALAVGCYLYQYEPHEIGKIFNSFMCWDDTGYPMTAIRKSLKERFPKIEFTQVPKNTSIKVKTKAITTEEDKEKILDALESLMDWPCSHVEKSKTLKYYDEGEPSATYQGSLHHPLFCPQCGGLPLFIKRYRNKMQLDDFAAKLKAPELKQPPRGNGPSGGSTGGNRKKPPPPDPKVLFERLLKARGIRRLFFFSNLLSFDDAGERKRKIRIDSDGKPILEFDPRLGVEPFDISQFVSYVELFGQDEEGDLLLAVFSLNDLEPITSEQKRYQILAQHAEWKFRCTITSFQRNADDMGHFRVQIEVIAGLINSPLKTEATTLWEQPKTAAWRIGPLIKEGSQLFVEALRLITAKRSGERRGATTRFTFSLAELGMKHSMTLSRDLALGFVIWPLICGAIIGGVLSALGQSGGMILFGMTDGTLMSLTGTVICGVAATLVGSAAAGVFVAVAFGIAHALLVSMAGIDHVINQVQNAEIMTTVLGGVASFVSPPIILLAITGGAILITSYLMGNSVREEQDRYPLSTKLWGAIIGSLAGGLIGVTYGLTQLLSNMIDDRIAFVLVFGPIGAAAFGAATLMKKISSKRSMAFGMMHFLVTLLIVTLGFVVFKGTKEGLIFTSMANAFFHGTFFVLSYLLGERIGGKWAGIGACALEGVGGYLGYLFVIHYLLN